MKTVLSLALLILVVNSDTFVHAESLKAGAAISNITPDIGAPVIGGFVPFPSTQIHDELNVRVLVLDDGSKKIALVVCDLLGIHRIVSEEARRLIQERHGIPIANVMISGTHTHSAPSALGDDRLEPEQKPNEYQAFVIRRIVDGVTRAINNLRPAKLAFGSGCAGASL
jgi:neutral ceramidase